MATRDSYSLAEIFRYHFQKFRPSYDKRALFFSRFKFNVVGLYSVVINDNLFPDYVLFVAMILRLSGYGYAPVWSIFIS